MRILNLKFSIPNIAKLTLLAAFLGAHPLVAEKLESTSTSQKPVVSVTVIPNPVRGKKVNFRVISDRAIKVRIRVYDRFLDTVTEFEKEGDKLFDALWNLKKIPEGIYYYQVQVTDLKTGEVTPISVQKFVILKEVKPAQK